MSGKEKTGQSVSRDGFTGLYQELLWLSDYIPADSFMAKAMGCTLDNIKWARRVAREDGFEIAEISASDVGDTQNTMESRWVVVGRPVAKEEDDELVAIRRQLRLLHNRLDNLVGAEN
jgi:hypothetical protein